MNDNIWEIIIARGLQVDFMPFIKT